MDNTFEGFARYAADRLKHPHREKLLQEAREKIIDVFSGIVFF